MRSQRFPFDLSFSTSDQPDVTRLRAGEHFRFDLDALDSFCLGDLPRHLVDLLRIASAVYVVDRLVKRRPKGGPKPPSRTIGLKVGVLEEGLWNRPDVRDALRDAVEFVTGDFWDIEFERDTQEYKWPSNFLPFSKPDDSPLVCLYSGGLDSAAGLVARMNENPARSVIPVTVWHQSQQRRLVLSHFESLRDHYRGRGFASDIAPLIVGVRLNWPALAQLPTGGFQKRDQELSLRSRAFLFSALGAIAAVLHDQQAVEMFESGVGAINLPLMAGMVGPKMTKNSHPGFLRLMSRLAVLVADATVEVRLPHIDKTKGDLVRGLARDGLKRFANLSASCVHYPRPGSEHKHCGICPGCIGRRQAMIIAGIDEPEGMYKFDIFGAPEAVNQVSEKGLSYLKAVLLQVARLWDIENHDCLPPAFERHVVPHIVQRANPRKESSSFSPATGMNGCGSLRQLVNEDMLGRGYLPRTDRRRKE